MIPFLWNLIGAVAAFVLILAALVYIVSPKHGGEMLRRLAIFLAGAFVGLCLLCQFVVHIRSLWLWLVGLAAILVAYMIRESRRGHPRPVEHHRGAERTPLPPQHEEDA